MDKREAAVLHAHTGYCIPGASIQDYYGYLEGLLRKHPPASAIDRYGYGDSMDSHIRDSSKQDYEALKVT
jgi:hypothetical protein